MASIRNLLFRPRWQHRSDEVRARAVAHEDDPRLLEALPGIAREDPAPTVRLAALRRLDDLLPLMRAAGEDDDPEVRRAAFRIYRAMLAGEHDHAPPLPERLELVPRLDDTALVEYLAEHARDEAIRAAAIDRISRPGLLGDLALAEPSRTLRAAIIERIDQPATLERVAEALRTSDKRTHRAARERLRALAGNDTDGAGDDALALCEALERLSRSGEPRQHKADGLERVVARWAALPEAPRARYERRFEGARKIIERLLAPAPAPDETPAHRALVSELEGALADAAQLSAESSLAGVHGVHERLVALREPAARDTGTVDREALEAAITRLAALEAEILERQPVDPRLVQLGDDAARLRAERATAERIEALRGRWRDAWSQRERTVHDEAVAERFARRLEHLDRAVQARSEARERALEALDGRMDALESALASGNLAASVRAKQQVLDTLQTIGRHPRVEDVAFRGRLAAARGRLRELRDWQHWANNKVRESLCVEAEGLVGSGLHPDALAARIKELRARWKELDDGERLPGDSPQRRPAPRLFRRFQTACNEAFTPAKGFFEKRAEYREQHQERLQGIAVRLEEAVADETEKDIRTLEQLVRAGRRSLRELNEIPPQARSAMARRLREGANRLDERLDGLYAVVERRKERLIEAVAALDPEADLDAAMASAKDAQTRWKDTGRTRRRREQVLWTRFRAACDRVFEHAHRKTAAVREAAQEKLAQLDALLADAERWVERAASDPEAADAALRRLHGEWREVGVHERARERRFQQLEQEARRVIADQRRAAERGRRGRLLVLAALCQEAEAGWFGASPERETLEVDATGLVDDAPAPLRARWARALGPAPHGLDAQLEASRREASELCIAMEFLAGIDSPEADRQARMDYQVHRLSARMSGDAPPLPREEAQQLAERWLALGPLPRDEATAFRERFERALAAVDALD